MIVLAVDDPTQAQKAGLNGPPGCCCNEMGAMVLCAEDVYGFLRDCYDPELPVNIVDLGLVYSVSLAPDPASKKAFPRQCVAVDITMTSPGCPSHASILEQVRNRLAGVPEISNAKVNLVWEPAWTPDRISQNAREKLGIG